MSVSVSVSVSMSISETGMRLHKVTVIHHAIPYLPKLAAKAGK